ncbi:hypothetical protein R1flu_024879 [Riccia fluitans]|uniref:Uncharacterized protein n=1 Tax=Riccia fluitans TaxID=41844 RepID=A0ABD1XW64_9MARC
MKSAATRHLFSGSRGLKEFTSCRLTKAGDSKRQLIDPVVIYLLGRRVGLKKDNGVSENGKLSESESSKA